MDKHYTPDISEFHPGFEFEYDTPQPPMGSTSKWEKRVYGDSNEENLIKTWNHHAGFIRVKYLDREDIESLGFKHIEEEVYEKYVGREGEYPEKYQLFIEDGKVEIWADILDLNPYQTLFHGTIKNKSELKRILAMIGVFGNDH